MINPARLIIPKDKFREAFPDLDFREVYSFRTTGNPFLITDPIYLADVYNSKSEIASFLRAHGVFIMDFGGDGFWQVWWKHPHLLIPISLHLLDEDLEPPEGVAVIASEVGTDSGSFIFLPITEELPPDLKVEIEKVLAENNGALLNLLAGKWSVFYEQWDAPDPNQRGLYRNIVLELKEDL